MLTPNYLREMGDEIESLYDRLTLSILRDMASSISRVGVTQTTASQMERLQEAGMLHGTIIQELSAITGRSDELLDEQFRHAGAKSLAYDDAVYRAAGLNPIAIKQSPRMLAILTAGLQKTQGSLRNLIMTTATAGQSAFVQAADLAYMQVASGAIPYTQAIADAVKYLARQGVGVVNYAGGVDRVDVAVRRAVLTGVNQTSAQMQIARLDEMGCDLVETTAHFGARPSHVPWQGRVFARRNPTDEYPDFEQETGYGTGGGLCGYNCRHSFFPYFEDASTPSYSKDALKVMEDKQVKYEGQSLDMYEASQKQRGMERDIRATKRELAAFDAARNATADPKLRAKLGDEFNASSGVLKRQQAELADFTRQTGLMRQSEREQVLGYSQSQASKASWAARR